MANSILKLRIDDQEYDAKLKKAVQGLQHLNEVAHKGAGEMTGLEKAEVDFIKALGDMETKSRSAAGRTRELESAFKELKVIYDNLNAVEKEDEGGKALAKSLETLKQRAQEARDQLNSASKALQENAESGKEDSSILGQLASKFVINVDAIKIFNTGLTAAKAALDVAKDAFFASEANVDEWGRTVAASESLYQSFLTSLNNTDISGFLTRIDEIVTAARKAYDELDRLGTMKTIQAPAISAQQTENERMRAMIQTGRYIAPVDGRTPTMQNGQQLTKEQIRRLEQQLQNGMNNVVKLVGNEVKQTGKAIDAVYNRQAKELGMSIKEFRKGTSSMVEFDKRVAGAEAYNKYEREHTNTVYNASTGTWTQKRDNTANPYESFKGWDVFRVDGERYNQLVQLIQQRDQQAAQAYGMQSQAYRAINRAEGTTVRNIMNGGSGGGSGSGGKGGSTKTTPADDVAKAEKDYADTISNAQQKLAESVMKSDEYDKAVLDGQKKLGEAYLKAYNATGDEKYLNAFSETADHIKEMQGVVDSNITAQKAAEQSARELEAAQKKVASAMEESAKAYNAGDLKGYIAAQKKVGGDATVGFNADTFGATESNIQAFLGNLKEQISQAELGSTLYNNLTAQLADATMLGNLMQEAVKNGIDLTEFDPQALWQRIFGEEPGDFIPDEFWEQVAMKFNETLQKAGKEISVDTNTGNVKENKSNDKELLQNIQKATSGLSQVTSGLQMVGLKIPEGLQTVLSALQGTMSIVQGVGTIVGVIQSVSMPSQISAEIANTAASTANTVALGALTAAVWANTASSFIPFSNGGVVPAFANGGMIGKAASGLLIPGNSFSGDNLRMPVDGGRGVIGVNSGELILNKAQQSNLANALDSGESGGGQMQPYVLGENIYFGLTNYLESHGMGELVTTGG